MLPDNSSPDLLGTGTDGPSASRETDQPGQGAPGRNSDNGLRRPKSNSDVTWLADPVSYPYAFPDKVADALRGVRPEIASRIGAASLGQAILVAAKVGSWAELGTPESPGLIPGHVRLTTGAKDETTNQLAMLTTSSEVLGLLRASVRATGDAETGTQARKGTKLSICLECGRWLVASSASTSKSCPFTEHCPGSPFAVPSAERLAVSPEQLSRPTA